MKQYVDKKEILISKKDNNFNAFVKNNFLKALAYEKALKEKL